MTWAFLYLVSVLVGLVLAAVSGFLSDLRALATHHLVVTHASHHGPLIDVVGRALSPGVIFFGIGGFVLATSRNAEPARTALIAAAIGVVGVVLGRLVVPRRVARAGGPSTGVAVRDIAPGGYGQIRLGDTANGVLMAAQSVDEDIIPGGAAVHVVDSTRSVLTVRRLDDRPA
jgi:hypothetical protein